MSEVPRRVLQVLSVAFVLLGGCGFALDASPAAELRNQCSGDGPCAEGSCDLTIGRCVATEAATYPLIFRVTPGEPAAGVRPVARHVGGATLDAAFQQSEGAAVDLALPGIITVTGHVCKAGTAPVCNRRVSASLTFMEEPSDASGSVPGTSAVLAGASPTSVTRSEPLVALDGALADYSVRLVRGRDYQVHIQPLGDDANEFHPISKTIRVPSEGDVTRIDMSEWANPQVLEGRMVSEDDTPVPDLRVEAIDRTTRRGVSSIATSGADGSFALRIAPTATDFLISIRANSQTDEPATPSSVAPTLLQDPDFFFPDVAIQNILFPTAGTIEVSGEVRGPSGAPVEGAVLEFSSSEPISFATGQLGEYQARASTGSNGAFSLALVPGRYQVVITPPVSRLDSSILVTEKDYSVGTSLREQWSLPSRTVIRGSVFSFTSQAMEQVRVLASAQRPNRSNDIATGFGGGFSLPVDPGVYDLAFWPPQGSGFAWVIFPDQAIDPERGADLDVSVPAPALVQGQLLDALGSPLPAAEVEAFAQIPDRRDDSDLDVRWILVGRASADDTGSYTLLLPPSLN